MSDLISRSALLKSIKGVEVAWYIDGNYTTYDDSTIVDIIEEQPTVEAIPKEKVQEIVEKLQEDYADARNSVDIEEDYYLGMYQGLQYAICHVKEVGGIDG